MSQSSWLNLNHLLSQSWTWIKFETGLRNEPATMMKVTITSVNEIFTFQNCSFHHSMNRIKFQLQRTTDRSTKFMNQISFRKKLQQDWFSARKRTHEKWTNENGTKCYWIEAHNNVMLSNLLLRCNLKHRRQTMFTKLRNAISSDHQFHYWAALLRIRLRFRKQSLYNNNITSDAKISWRSLTIMLPKYFLKKSRQPPFLSAEITLNKHTWYLQ